MSEPKKIIDWEAIEKDWRAGIKSVLQIAGEHGISHTAINKRFKKLGVPRDLKDKIKEKADALVSASVVSALVSTETTPKAAEIIEANAKQLADIQITERKDIGRNRSLAMKLLDELESSTDNKELFAQLGEIMSGSEEVSDSMKALYRKVISMPARIDSMQKLANTMKVLIELERKVYGIDGEKKSADDKLDDLLAMLDGKASSLLPE